MAETLQLTGLDGVYEMLQGLPAEVVSKRGGVIKAALRKGAVVFLKAELLALDVSLSNATKEDSETTGLLKANVIVTRGKPPTDGKGERYVVRIRRKIYPRPGKRSVNTVQTGQRLEYGTSKQPAEPWIRPAFLSKAEEAIRTVETETLAGVQKAAASLLKQGGA